MKPSRSVEKLYERFLRKAPQQSRSRGLVESVLGAAAELVGRHSDDDDVTVQEVADRAGVGVGSLYDYFEDRTSVLAGFAAKLTEDNLRRFEAELAEAHGLPLDVAVGRVVDFMFATYLRDVRIPRAVLRIAHRVGLMPTLAESHAAFAKSLERALRERDDVGVSDLEAAAVVVTNMAMGVVHVLIWSSEPKGGAVSDDRVRRELVAAIVSYLGERGGM